MKAKATIVSLFLLTLSSVELKATWSTPADVSSSADNVANPRITIDSSGDVNAVWAIYNGSEYVIQSAAQPSGSNWGTPSTLSATGQNAYGPEIKENGAGDAIAVWDRFNGSYSIIQASVRTSGGNWSSPVNISSTSQDSYSAHVGVDSSGNGTAVWMTFDGTNYLIQASYYTAGTGWSSPTTISTTGQDSYSVRVAVNGNGNTVATWETFNGTNLLIQSSAYASGSWSSPATISTASTDSGNAQLELDSSGNAVATWYTNDGTNYRINTATRSSGTWSSPTILSASGGDAFLAKVAVNSGGEATAVWTRSNGTNFIIQSTTRPSAGSWSSVADLSATGNDATAPHVANATSGNTVAVWDRFNGSNDIIQAATKASGGSWSSAVNVSASGEDSYTPVVAIDSNGNATTVWSNYVGTTATIQASNGTSLFP